MYYKNFREVTVSFPEIRAKLWKNALSCNDEYESFKKLLDLDRGVDDFQSYFGSSSSKETSLVKFS